jgi:Calx-beta domain
MIIHHGRKKSRASLAQFFFPIKILFFLISLECLIIPLPTWADITLSTGTAGIGNPDINFTGTDPSGNIFTPVGILNNPGWIDPIAGTNWIGPINGNQDGMEGWYEYIYEFNLDSISCDPSIEGQNSSDNGLQIFLNGNQIFDSVDPANPGTEWTFQSSHPFSTSSGFLVGTNTLTFKIINELGASPNPTSLYVNTIIKTCSLAPPVANNVNISLNPTGTPTLKVGETLKGNYTYSDIENDPEGISIFQWYTATDATCTTGKTAISGATSQTYTLTNSEVDKYLCFEVTPVAASGASHGMTVLTTSSSTLPVTNLEFALKITGEGSVTTKTTFASGDPTLVLTAQPAVGFKFIGFSGSACTTGHLILNATTECEATFVPILSGTAGFSASHYEAIAGKETLTVIVKRSEGTEGNLTVNYATQDDTAKAGWDYVAAQGSLTWAEGESDDKVITISLLDAPMITAAEALNGEKVFTIQLTAANDKILDTAQLSLLAEHPLASVPPELITPEPTVAMPEEVVGDTPLCAATSWLNVVCNAKWRTVTDLKVGTEGNLSTAVLKGTIDNQGWVSNLIIKPTSQVKGGIVTGYIYNQGTLSNFEFRGYRIVGGTLAGDIFNTSDVNGFFQDVQLAPHTQIRGGILQGRIIGDSTAPAWLENLTVKKGSYLANVTFGNHVTLEEDVTLEGTVPLPKLSNPVATDVQGHEIHHLTTQFLGGIAVNQGQFQQQVQQPRAATAEIRGRILVDSQHSGQVAEILVYVAYQPLPGSSQVSYFMLDTQGKVLPWDKNLAHLVAFQRNVTLNTWQEVPIYQGLFPVTGVINIYFAYRLPDGTVVTSGESVAVTVTE